MLQLTTSFSFKGIQIKNRIVMPPMGTEKATPEGEVTKELIEHYVDRAKNKVGMIIVEHSYVDLLGQASKRQLGIHMNDLVNGLSRLANTIKKQGVPIGIQINHCGAKSDVIKQPLSASPVPVPDSDLHPRRLNSSQIREVHNSFARAAERARRAGFDFVEIHGAHGFLLNQFYSPLTNKRTDEYGGDREARLKFILEVIEAVRGAVGDDYPVAYRLGANDMMEGGLTLEDGAYAAQRIEETGVDLLDLSGGHIGYLEKGEEGFFVYMAEKIKPLVNIPVLVTGGIRNLEYAEKIVENGITDLIGVGRPLYQDATWARKALVDLAN